MIKRIFGYFASHPREKKAQLSRARDARVVVVVVVDDDVFSAVVVPPHGQRSPHHHHSGAHPTPFFPLSFKDEYVRE